VDGDLRLKPGVSLDHEEAALIEVEVTVTDAGGLSQSESFTVNVLDVNEGPVEVGLDGSSVSENETGATVGRLSVVDPDVGDSHSFEVSDDRFEVVDGDLRLKPGVSLDHEDAASIEVEVTVTDAGGLSLSESFTIDVVDVNDMSFSSGFHVKYFDVDHSASTMADIDWETNPTHQEVSGQVDYATTSESFWEGGATDTFGVEISGNIEVEEGGAFTFYLGGDDGAVLVVDGVPLIDNDGDHGFRTRTGEIELEPGTHNIELRYFENFGVAGLKLEWEGPGLTGVELVTAPDMSEAQTVSGMPLAFDVDMGSLNIADDTSFVLEGLPEGTIVEAGAHTVVVGEDGAAELVEWQGDMLMVTPPADFTGQVDAELSHSTPISGGGTTDGMQVISFDVNEAQLTAPSAEMVGGFHASYFDVDHSLGKLDDVDWETDPTYEEMVSEINYENSAESFWEGGSNDTFGAKLEGQVTIDEGGTYNFFAGGDDGVVLYVNGKEVIDNDGLHGFQTRSGEIDLEPGTYDIEVRYFENIGHAGLKLEWEGPDTDGREVVQADTAIAAEENGTIEVGIDLSGASDQTAVMLDGLPANTILMSGDDAALSDGGPVNLTGWNIDFLELSPPPGFEGAISGEILVADVGFNGASVSSSSAFSLTVGEVADVQSDEMTEVMEVSAGIEGGAAQAEAGWDAEIGEDDAEAEGSGDVMAEPTVNSVDTDIGGVDTETYERVDW